MIDAGELEDAACPNGCPRDDEPVLAGRDRLYRIPGEFRIVRCRHCGLMRTNPRPTPGAMGRYYPDDYGPYLGTQARAAVGGHSAINRALRAAYRAVFRYRANELPAVPPGRLLEIGCAGGAFLQEMAGRGWTVAGFEFSAAAAAGARRAGLDVRSGAVEEASPPDAPADLVAGWMVLEHLHQPVEVLRKLGSWSAPGAWLVLSVPNAGSRDFRWFGDCGYAVQLPTHLFHFTPTTLTALLDRAGWRVERILHQRTLANWTGGLALWLEARGAPGWLWRWLRRVTSRPRFSSPLLYPLAALLAAFGQTGRMTIWARRREDRAASAGGHGP